MFPSSLVIYTNPVESITGALTHYRSANPAIVGAKGGRRIAIFKSLLKKGGVSGLRLSVPGTRAR
jgi:hypothetical protein